MSVPFSPVSVRSLIRIVSVPLRSILVPFHFVSISLFLTQIHFVFCSDFCGCLLSFQTPFLICIFFCGYLVLFSGCIPPLNYFFLSFPFSRLVLFLFCFSSISALFDSVSVLVPFCCGFRSLLFRVRSFSVSSWFVSVPSRIRYVSYPFLFRFLFHSFSFRVPISVGVRLICFLGTPFGFRSVPGSCLIFPPFGSFLFVFFRHSSVFNSFLIRFRSFRFRLFNFHSFSVSYSFYFLRSFSLPFRFSSVTCCFRYVPYPFN